MGVGQGPESEADQDCQDISEHGGILAGARAKTVTARIAESALRIHLPFLAGSAVKMILMANLTLVYGMRLLPADEVTEVADATLKLKNGREARVTMHVLEGSKEDIEKQLKSSLEAFFDFYPEI